MRRFKLLTVSITLSAMLLSSVAANEDVAEYRHLMMESIGAHMKSANMILRGQLDNWDHLQVHAEALRELGDIMPSLFTEGSEGGEALEVIWEEPEEFSKRVVTFQDAASSFASAATGDDRAAVGEAFGQVGRSCKGCHDRYREE